MNDYQIHQPFLDSFYIKFRPSNADKLIKHFMSVKCEGISPYWADNCNVKTTNFLNGVGNERMSPIYEEICNHFKRDVGIVLGGSWVNYYERGSYQELHDHFSPNIDLSGVMFLNDGPDFSQFYFWNRSNNSLTANLVNLLDLPNHYKPDVKPGDVLIFPSTLIHGVTQHHSDTVRRTLSFNIQVIKQ